MSGSLMLRVPLTVVALSSVTLPVSTPPITGASLLPVTVTVTVRVSLAPWLSVTVTSKLTWAVSPAARFWKSLPGLKL